MGRALASLGCILLAMVVYLLAHGPEQANLSAIPLIFVLVFYAGRLSNR